MALIYICISYIFGIIWELNQAKLGLVPFFIFLLFEISYLLFRNKTLKEKVIIASLCLIFIIFGFFYSSYRINKFKYSYSNNEIYFAGEITRKLGESEYYNKYVFKNKNNDNFLLYISKETFVEENDLIEFTGKYESPSVERNKGGFDYSKYLYSQGIYDIIFAKNNIQVIEHKANIINDIKNSILDVLGRCFPKEQFGISLGMFIGDTTYLSDETSNSFKDARNNTSFGRIRK